MPFVPNMPNPQFTAVSNGSALTSGIMTAVSIKLLAGQKVTSLSFVSATTAAGTPTHWGFALYSAAAVPVLIAQTADQATAAWAANTTKTLTLAGGPKTIAVAGGYWLGVWVTASAVPTLLSATAFVSGLLNSTGIVTGDKALAVTTGSGLTTTAPATIVTGGTPSLVCPLAYVS